MYLHLVPSPNPAPRPVPHVPFIPSAITGVYVLGPVLYDDEIGYIQALPVAKNHHEDDGHGVAGSKPLSLPWVAERVHRVLSNQWSPLGILIGVDEHMKLYRLEAGQGVVAPHQDEDFDGPFCSRATWSILLNLGGGYRGGETFFNGVNEAPRVQFGGALVFPHKLLHEGRAVASGVKYVLKTDLFVLG